MQAIYGDPLMRVSADMPDDVHVLHDALQNIRDAYGVPGSVPSERTGVGLTLHLKNCGTALRFLQVHLERCYPGAPVTLTGDPRLMERNGAPTSQTHSALLMHGVDIPASPDESPYITMTRRLMECYQPCMADAIERDWSAAAFWYEYVAIHGGELLLEDLTADSIQGDRIVADIYARHFGVRTTFTPDGACLSAKRSVSDSGLSAKRSVSEAVSLDFGRTPDLYPAIALTCERLGITLHADGTERLRYKECDRLEAVRMHQTRHDHRMAMALLVAGFPVDDTDCIRKSYPAFLEQFNLIRQTGSI
jgi:5-enolpyruvylshikimate-3-phosphate synthase